MTVFKKLSETISMIQTLILAASLLAGCRDFNGTNSSYEKRKQIVQRGDYVYFTLADTDFKIPRKYFRGGASDSSRLTSVKLWALLPDFEGYNPKENHFDFIEESGWGRKLWVTLHQRSDSPIVSKKIESKAKTRGTLYKRVGLYNEIRYGLEYYRCSNSIYCSEFFLHRVGDVVKFYIRCPGKKLMPQYPSCHAFWDYSAGIGVEMVFGMQHLQQWESIWKKAQALLRNADVETGTVGDPRHTVIEGN